MSHIPTGATDSLAVLGFIDADGRRRSTEHTQHLTLEWFRQYFGAGLPEDAATADRGRAESGSRKVLSTFQTEGKNSVWACWLDNLQPASPGACTIIETVIWSSGNCVKRIGFRLLGVVPPDPRLSGIDDMIQALGSLHAAVTQTTPRFEFVRSEESVRKLAALLLDEKRKAPVIVLSTRRNGKTALDAKEVAASTSGLARVYVIRYEWTRPLTRRIGNKLAVFGGSVRVYLPRLRKNEDPQRHKLYLIRGWTEKAAAQTWGRLRILVAEQSAERYRSQGSQIPYSTVEMEVITSRRRPGSVPVRLQSLLEQIGVQVGTGLTWAKRRVASAGRALAGVRRRTVATDRESSRFALASVRRKLRESEQSRRKLSRQLSTAQRQLVQLEAQNKALKESLRRESARAKKLARLLARHQLPTKWDDIIGWCERQFDGKLLLHSTVSRDLHRARYEDVGVAAVGLHWLAEHYRLGRLNGRGTDLRGAIPDGQGVHNERCGSDSFNVDWQGRVQNVEWHLRKGNSRDPRHCLRIYYFWDPTLEQVVVAGMPTHRNSPR